MRVLSSLAARLRLWLILLAGLPIAWPLAAHAASLTVIVDHVPDARGHVRIAICTKPEFLGMHCRYDAVAAAAAGSVRVVVPNVAPGLYALQAFQDINDNDKVDRSMLGIPTEPIGFSRDAKLMFGPPRFADAAIRIGDQDCETRFSLRGF